MDFLKPLQTTYRLLSDTKLDYVTADPALATKFRTVNVKIIPINHGEVCITVDIVENFYSNGYTTRVVKSFDFFSINYIKTQIYWKFHQLANGEVAGKLFVTTLMEILDVVFFDLPEFKELCPNSWKYLQDHRAFLKKHTDNFH